ncbi:MAG: 50S ribosomal protein L24 [Candidatus Competibacteraceae bacterium]|jgi:large subunit ribosomal protein L24|nr:50S ribosomal protein L24 [Candidatus Competibacteraceae bacterium]
MRRIKNGDEVIVISGKNKGRQGQVIRIIDDKRVLVEGVNMIKRHTRGNPSQGTPGGIVEKEAPLHVSNVMLFNPRTGKGSRVGFRTLEDGRKVRYFKADNEVVDV